MTNQDAPKEFNDLTVKELKAVAEQFAVDLKNGALKPAILKRLSEDGVTFNMYRSMLAPDDTPVDLAAVDPAPAEVEHEETVVDDEDAAVVVKMTRRNWTYEIRGYRFTQQNPYALVKEDDADYLIEQDGGFRMASPKELREYYGA